MSLRTKSNVPPPAALEKPSDTQGEEEQGEDSKEEEAAKEDTTWKSSFALGTEDGQLAYCTWVMPEGENASYIESAYKSHYAPLVAVHRSPFFEDCLLTVGDWTFSLFLA